MSEMEESGATAAQVELAEQVRPLVNEILDLFNRHNTSPAEAGMVILALISRLMQALEGHPEARRYFILTLINVINSYLTAEIGDQPVREESSAAGTP
jgi:hypothetical protein